MNDNFEEDLEQKADLSIWKRLIKYAMRNKGLVVLLIFTLMGVAAIDILYPLFLKYALDRYVAGNTVDGLGFFAAVYAVVVLLQGSGVFLFVSKAGKLEMQISYDIRQDAFKKLQELSFSYYDQTAVGYIMARMVSDISRLSEMIAWSIVDVMWAVAYITGCTVTMLVLNWRLALFVLVVIPPLALVCLYFQKRILKYQRNVRKTNSRITGAFNEGIMGAVTTKTLVREEKNADEFGNIAGEMRRASIKSATLSAIFLPLVITLGSVGTALALYKGGQAVFAGVIGFGTLAVFLSYSAQFFEPVQQLAQIFAEFQSAQASAERVIALIDTPNEIQDTAEVERIFGDNFNPVKENWPEINGDIEFENVSFSYKKGEKVLENFSLKVKAGENVALVGETGSGKSTIVNLVCRFYEPTGGRILIDGTDYRERSQLWLQSNLGYVLQSPHLFSGSIADNIRYGNKSASDEEVRRAAELVSALEFIERQPKGFDSEVGEGGILLSTGQKLLISFARVVLANPCIFVLDEATASVDTETEQLIQNAIVHILKGRTSFIVAHRLSTIRNADRILVIDKGCIAEQGSHAQLMAKRGQYYELYTNQFREEAKLGILGE